MKKLLARLLPAVVIIILPIFTYANDKVSRVIAADEINWGYLNPLRGALSPEAANIWGDRTKDTATGMLVRFKKGFQSPPHIHNITYRGVVIDGLLHNASPNADKMWMPKGSFWTQPAGQNHITAANGNTNLIYLEIDSGPYLVKPSKVAFENGESAVNLHKDNIVWLGHDKLKNIKADGVEMAYMWTNTKYVSGSLVKLPKGFKGKISTESKEFRAVLISGEANYSSEEQDTIKLTKGSYFESNATFQHNFKTSRTGPTIFYIRSDAQFQIDWF